MASPRFRSVWFFVHTLSQEEFCPLYEDTKVLRYMYFFRVKIVLAFTIVSTLKKGLLSTTTKTSIFTKRE